MGVRGSFAELAALRQKIRDVGSLKNRLIVAAANEARSLVATEFRSATDPTGKPWAPLKRRRRGQQRRGKPLNGITGRFARSFVVLPSVHGFTVSTPREHARFHQSGTRKMVARQIVPSGGQLTDKWRGAIDKTTDTEMRAFFAKK